MDERDNKDKPRLAVESGERDVQLESTCGDAGSGERNV